MQARRTLRCECLREALLCVARSWPSGCVVRAWHRPEDGGAKCSRHLRMFRCCGPRLLRLVCWQRRCQCRRGAHEGRGGLPRRCKLLRLHPTQLRRCPVDAGVGLEVSPGTKEAGRLPGGLSATASEGSAPVCPSSVAGACSTCARLRREGLRREASARRKGAGLAGTGPGGASAASNSSL